MMFLFFARYASVYRTAKKLPLGRKWFGSLSYQTQMVLGKDNSQCIENVVDIVLDSLGPLENLNFGMKSQTNMKLFVSENSKHAIDGISNNAAIFGVPVDKRRNGKEVFDKYIEIDFPSAKDRKPLLCNIGNSGQGKSIMQAFNLLWFAKDGTRASIEVTFNDDQGDVASLNSYKSLDVAVGCRIVHRVMSSLASPIIATSVFKKRELQHIIANLDSPIENCLMVVRKIIGRIYKVDEAVATNMEIMLGVDELRKWARRIQRTQDGAAKDTTRTLMSNMLGELTHLMDKESNRLVLTVSALDSIDLVEISTGSKRPVWIQPLPPLLLLDSQSIPYLPKVLQCLCDPMKRVKLPADPNSLQQYALLSELVLGCVSNSRRLSRCLELLRELDGDVGDTEINYHSIPPLIKSIVGKIKENIGGSNNQASFVRLSPSDEMVAHMLESIAKDVGCRFALVSDDDVDRHTALMQGSTQGFCHFLQDLGIRMEGFAFLPLDVIYLLGNIDSVNRGLRLRLGPCGQALVYLAASVTEFNKVQLVIENEGTALERVLIDKEKMGKAWEKVAAHSLLLLARSENVFFPLHLCDRERVGQLLNGIQLKGSERVQLWDDVEQFPRKQHRPIGIHVAVTELIESHIMSAADFDEFEGAVFMPREKYNMGGDAFGLFRVCGARNVFALIALQAKDWFKPYVKSKNVGTGEWEVLTLKESWKKSKKEFQCAEVTTAVHGKEVRIKIFNILVLTNEHHIEDVAPIQANDGVITLKSMRTWLPSAAFNCEAAHRLRAMLGDIKERWEESN